MRTILLLMISLFIANNAISQFERNRYQTLSSTIKISAMKNGESYIWENKNINLVLDYKVGNLQVILENKDFVNVNETQPSPIDSVEADLEYIIKGILPINDIINQLVIKNQYFVELNLINRELGLDNPVQFDLTVTNPGTSQRNYRMFSLHGIMYNQDLQLPAFEGFDDKIEIWIGWVANSLIH